MSGSVTLRRRAGTAAPHYAVWYPLTFLALRLEHYFVSRLNPKGQGRSNSMPRRTDKPGSVSKMSNEDAEFLRELLRRTEPADMSDPSVHERVGKEIAKAMHRPFKQ
jgi:hypothetical protein